MIVTSTQDLYQVCKVYPHTTLPSHPLPSPPPLTTREKSRNVSRSSRMLLVLVVMRSMYRRSSGWYTYLRGGASREKGGAKRRGGM